MNTNTNKTNLFIVSVNLKAICRNHGIDIKGNSKKTVLGHSQTTGLQGQVDNALFQVMPNMNTANFMMKLGNVPTSIEKTAQCQTAQLTNGKNKNISVTLRAHDGIHAAWKVWEKLAYLSGNTSQRNIAQLEKFFYAVNGHKPEALSEIRKALQPVYEEMTDLKTVYKNTGKIRFHCLETSEVQLAIHDLKEKFKSNQIVNKEIDMAWAIYEAAQPTIPEIPME